ncbi:hypothetical protein EJB05_33175, partial [Eragrostis curvula]
MADTLLPPAERGRCQGLRVAGPAQRMHSGEAEQGMIAASSNLMNMICTHAVPLSVFNSNKSWTFWFYMHRCSDDGGQAATDIKGRGKGRKIVCRLLYPLAFRNMLSTPTLLRFLPPHHWVAAPDKEESQKHTRTAPLGTSQGVLSWETRYQIALGVARGLDYLHEKCWDCIIPCDIKPENILLDDAFAPKVADFRLSQAHRPRLTTPCAVRWGTWRRNGSRARPSRPRRTSSATA